MTFSFDTTTKLIPEFKGVKNELHRLINICDLRNTSVTKINKKSYHSTL